MRKLTKTGHDESEKLNITSCMEAAPSPPEAPGFYAFRSADLCYFLPTFAYYINIISFLPQTWPNNLFLEILTHVTTEARPLTKYLEHTPPAHTHPTQPHTHKMNNSDSFFLSLSLSLLPLFLFIFQLHQCDDFLNFPRNFSPCCCFSLLFSPLHGDTVILSCSSVFFFVFLSHYAYSSFLSFQYSFLVH